RDLRHRACRLHRPRARARAPGRAGLLRVARAVGFPHGEDVSQATLLVELLTEELPPKSLKELAGVFSWNLYAELKKDSILAEGSEARISATPRRVAVSITNVEEKAAAAEKDVQGPPVSAAAQAVAGFAKKNGVAVEALQKQQGPKGEVYVAKVT